MRIAERLFSTITENNKIYFTILENGKDPDDIVKERGKEGFLKLLENKVVIQKFLWNKYIEKININNPYEVAKFEKSIRRLCNQIQDKTLKKYILEDYLIKISKLTPHVNLNNKFKFSKKQNFKVLNETKKIHMQKKSFSRLDLLEMSILFIMLNYKNVVKSKIKKLIETNFETIENNNLKLNLINLYGSNNTNKELKNSILEDNKNLIEKINKNINLQIILDNKNYQQIESVLEDLINDFDALKNKEKIESLEKKLINNMEEGAYAELIELKSQLNRE